MPAQEHAVIKTNRENDNKINGNIFDSKMLSLSVDTKMLSLSMIVI